MKKLIVLLQKKAPLWVYNLWHMKEKLTTAQHELGLALIAEVPYQSELRPRLFILIGQVGAGKSSVAKYIAKKIKSAAIVSANDIRLRLRKVQNSYAGDRAVGEFVIYGLLNRGYTVIADSDHGDERKRKSLLARVKGIPNLEVHYIRVHADYDVLAQRIFEKTKYEGETIYSVAAEKSKERVSSAVIRLREFWRRTPHHYDWVEQGGGQWKLKKPPVKLLADLDTGGDWEAELSTKYSQF
jgi:predicted kinase